MSLKNALVALALGVCLASSGQAADNRAQTEKRPAIVNIVNFVRGVEPRYADLDLTETLEKEIELVQGDHLAATWLVQYDALKDERFAKLLRKLDSRQEIGGWLEIVQPMVEKAGLKWRGRYPWDWHACVDLSIGYTPDERRKLVDVYMEEFKRTFGRYPKSVGSWLIDAQTLAYLSDRYGVVASCNCKDQYGTDGYTLWGGYYNQAYYPSRQNAFMPAQHESNQIPIPVFRMLGSDPIYQYDVDYGDYHSEVITLEPACREGGGNPEWVDWFFNTNFGASSLSFGYAQVGQENSFRWERVTKGISYQVHRLRDMASEGRVRVETLADSGEWFRKRYPVTPASAITSLTDWKKEGHKSIWYSSRFYRTNLYWEASGFRVRDIQLFDEEYAEPYLTKTCATDNCAYDALPVMDGLLWRDRTTPAGIRVFRTLQNGSQSFLKGDNPKVKGRGERLSVECDDGLSITCQPAAIRFSFPSNKTGSWGLQISWSKSKGSAVIGVDGNTLLYAHNGRNYAVRCEGGTVKLVDESTIRLTAASNHLSLTFRRR